jgi:predicted porin
MQKKLIALAVAGLVSGAAFADGSSVTIYGIADGSFDIISTSGAKTSGNNTGSFNRVSSNSSYLGFKGSEDLGNGTKALFQFESGVGFDTSALFSSTRDSYVGLNGGFGTVELGTLTGPTRALGVALDVNAGATSIGANSALLGKIAGNLIGGLNTAAANPVTTPNGNAAISPANPMPTCARSTTCGSAFDTRQNNTIAYISPVMGGFSLAAAYVANENKGNNAASSKPNTNAYDLGATYANGPITVMATYADVKTKRASDDVQVKDARIAGIYNFGKGDVRLLWDQTKGSDNSGGGEAKQTVWGAGLTFGIGANGKLLTQYYKANDVKCTGCGNDSGANLFELGYEHSLSKRTTIKAIYSRLSNKDNAAYDYGVNATGISANGIDLSGFQVGIRHAF